MNLKKRFPSYQMVLSGIVSSSIRFPLSLLCAIAVALAAVCIADDESLKGFDNLQRLILCAGLGLPLFVALQTLSERLSFSVVINYAIQGLGVVALLLYYLSLPDGIIELEGLMFRHLLLGIGVHLLVAWLPFAKNSSENLFWQYNKTLFLRFLTAALYAGALYAGLAIALASAEHLFDLNVKGVRYFQLWIVIAGIFHPWFFLSGVPSDFKALEQEESYPKGLKVFAQFILLPLVGLYSVILYAYEAKIALAWNWPRGWVSELILWYAVVGILSLLLLHPLRKKTENRWIEIFSKWYFLAIIPLLVMLILAIARRVTDYGITEPRYFVCAMALGLTVVVLYFIFSKVKDIRIIPFVLCALAFGSAYGPWSASSVSLRSQQGRMDAFLVETGRVNAGELTGSRKLVELEKRREISNIADYLSQRHGAQAFEPWLSDSVLNVLDTTKRWSQGPRFLKEVGLIHVRPYRGGSSGGNGRFEFVLEESAWTAVGGQKYLIDNIQISKHASHQDYVGGDYTLTVVSDLVNSDLVNSDSSITNLDFTILNSDHEKIDSATLSFETISREAFTKPVRKELSRNRLTTPLDFNNFEGEFVITRIIMYKLEDSVTVADVRGMLLLSENE